MLDRFKQRWLCEVGTCGEATHATTTNPLRSHTSLVTGALL